MQSSAHSTRRGEVTPELLGLLGFAFVAGLVTFFAPCAAPLLPGYVAYFLGDPEGMVDPEGTLDATTEMQPSRVGVGRAALVGGLVSAGVFATYLALAGVVAWVGSAVLANVAAFELVVGGTFVIIGGAMAANWHPAVHVARLPARRRSLGGYVGFGALYAAAAAGCTAPVFVAVATVALAAGSVTAVLTFGAYAAGVSTLVVGLTILTAVGRVAVFRRLALRFDRLYRLTGVLLLFAGVGQLYYFVFRFDGLATLG